MKSFYIPIFILIGIGIGILIFYFFKETKLEAKLTVSDMAMNTGDISDAQIIANNLHIPWDFVFLPNGDILITERRGKIIRITGENKQEVPGLDDVYIEDRTEDLEDIYNGNMVDWQDGRGLFGITLHPNFTENDYLYLYYTYRTLSDSTTRNKVERYTYVGNTLTSPHTIIENIPSFSTRNGGRIAFGPDSHLYITTGDAAAPHLAQDLTSLAGKILRLRDDGGIPDDNPFANSPVYSYGHRNPQGLTWDTDGNLWSTEHGSTGLDEINLIHPGNNYGWPDSKGDTVQQGTIAPKQHSGPKTTWAPSGIAYHNGNLYFGALRGEALYVAPLNGTTLLPPERRYHSIFKRIRTVKVGPDNALYITTSNADRKHLHYYEGRLMGTHYYKDKLIRLPLQ